ncbi:hypothetical protein Avbf_18001 [Armadillidium vulgare]|nr:hypothetical protein Avbf_18001 [Armadillidium vulgare]
MNPSNSSSSSKEDSSPSISWSFLENNIVSSISSSSVFDLLPLRRVQSQRPDVFSIIDQGYPHPRVRFSEADLSVARLSKLRSGFPYANPELRDLH